MLNIIHNTVKVVCFEYFRRVKKSCSIFNCHQVSLCRDIELHNKVTWTSIDVFKRQIKFLKSHYDIISLTKGVELLEQGKLNKNYAVLTFDDGDASIKDIIPILEKENIPATFFINSAYLDDKNKSWVNAQTYVQSLSNTETIPENVLYAVNVLRNTVNQEEYSKYRLIAEDYINSIKIGRQQYLTTQELFSISNPLFSIGLHGHEHQRYSMMTKDWCEKDVDNCINVLSKHHLYIPIIAFPFGKSHDWDDKTVSICFNRGLTIMLHDGGVNYKKRVLYNRIPSDGRIFNTNFLASNFIS